MSNGTAAVAQQTQASQQAQEAADRQVEAARVGPFDIDFMFVLLVAVFVDGLDVILELTGVLIVPKLIGMVIDVLTLGLGFWAQSRTGRIIEAKTHRETMGQQISQQMTQRARGAQTQLASARNPVRRVWLRMFAVFLLELIPFVGLLPMWTITIVGTLRQK